MAQITQIQSKAEKRRFARADALPLARVLCAVLKPVCLPERVIVAGSLRRGRADVGDIEIVYVSRVEERPDPEDMFARVHVALADEVIAGLEREGTIEKRLNVNGSEMFGPRNKLVRHVASGIPVDLFAASEDNWWNYLVCRTGPGESNIRICEQARLKGWKWNPYGVGFTNLTTGEVWPVLSEEAVFRFLGMEYQEPKYRK